MRLKSHAWIVLTLLTLSSPIASAEVVVIVNPASKQGSIGDDDIKRIFLGKVKSFPNGEAATPVDQSEGTSARERFYSNLIGKSEAQLKAYWSQLIFSGKGTPPKTVGNDQETKDWVAKNHGGIGYVDKSVADNSVTIVGKVN